MRMSCNGCRILRKGCSESCSIKPCLEWIKSPEAQANATVFLAKFYGRAGLLNLINAGPDHLRPAIFRSLLYEACGRIVNPVYGSAGLLSSGSWQLCQAAVEAVLSGAPIVQVSADSAASTMTGPPLQACNIRHVAKEEKLAAKERGLHKVRGRGRFMKSGAKPKPRDGSPDVNDAAHVIWSWSQKEEVVGSPSHESGLSQQVESPCRGRGSGSDEKSESMETVEESLAKQDEPADESEVELELTLGFEPSLKQRKMGSVIEEPRHSRDATCKIELK